MPLPPVPSTGTPSLDEYLKALHDALQHDLYRVQPDQATTEEVDDAIQDAVAPLQAQIDQTAGVSSPPGMIVAYGGSTAPTGWLACDGSTVAKADYPALHAAIGATWGAGGETTFVLPNLVGRTLRGGFVGQLGGSDTVALPAPGAHTHLYNHTTGTPVDVEIVLSNPVAVIAAPLVDTPVEVEPNASASQTLTVTNPYAGVLYIIKT